MGASKTYNIAKRFYYWPGMFDGICALTADCLTCQNNKPKPKHRKEIPLKEWQKETVPFRTIHIDHKGHLYPPSIQSLHCFLVIDAFSRFLMEYPVTNTGAEATISAVEKWIHSFGIPQSIVHGGGRAFINTEFNNWTKELGFTLRPRTAHSPWTNGKIETQNQHTSRCWRDFLTTLGTIGLPWHRNLLLLTILVSIIQPERHLMKSSLLQNLKSLCLQNLDFTAMNINFVALNSAKTYHLTHTVRTI